MKVLIIDDETVIQEALRELLTVFCPEVIQIECAHNVETGIEAIHRLQPDILFLDIELGNGTGFDILNQIPLPQFQLIFTTAHDRYAIHAFQFAALDFLLKPIDPDLLQRSVQRATENINSKNLYKQLQLMQQLLLKKESDRKIVLKDNQTAYFIRLDDILFCQAEGAYSKFHIRQSEPILVSKNLKEYDTLLSPLGFLRVHHSYLVNPNRIRLFDKKEGGALILEDNQVIPISHRKKDIILKILESRF
ncbi:MAG: response regulator transcription factor [Saprospiraceae bacterium]|nr:response regulator transcription factor [Saprospiraceae bacterium]